MSHTMVTYTVKPGREQENAALVRAVFEELAQTRPAGFRYAASSCRTRASSHTCTPMKAPQPAHYNSRRRSKRSWPRPRIATSNRPPSRSQS